MLQERELPLERQRQIYLRLKEQIATLKGRRLLIVGDIGIDEYVMGWVKRISPEAPVPVVEVYSQDERLGLAANVAQNVASLGGRAELVAAVGVDSAADRLRSMLQSSGVDAQHLLPCQDRPTTRKLRVMAEHHHIVRVDFEHKKFLSAADEQNVLQRVEERIAHCDAVILEDYAKGVLTEKVCQTVIAMAKNAGKRVLADPHPTTPAEYYRGVDLMTPNRDEAVALSGLNVDDLRERPDSLLEVGAALMDKTQSQQLIITRGKEGMSLFVSGGVTRIPTYARQVFDVTGAGDTVIATLALAWSAGMDLVDAGILANFAAGVVVGKVGCVPCTPVEILTAIDSHLQPN